MHSRRLTVAVLAIGSMLWLGDVGAQQPTAAPTKTAKPASKPGKADAKAPAVELVREARALELLKAMSDRLAGARSMSFTALVTYEFPSQLGPAIAYTTKSESRFNARQAAGHYLRRRPGLGFYYDGKNMMAFAPAENLVAIAGAADDRWCTEGGLRVGGYLLSVYRRDRRRSLRRDRTGAQARVLHRSIQGGRRCRHRHGGDCERQPVPADLDWRRGQIAADDACGVS